MHSAAAYRSLIERLEREAAARPRWYKFKLTLLAMLGYAFLIAAIVVALALSLGIGLLLLLTKSVWALKLIKFVWIPLVLAWMILKALWVRLTGPEGHLLGPGEAPELVAEVERLRQATGAPRLSGIVIDARFNAAAASVPRMLGLAGSRHFLILGLPLMRALGPDQLAAVIAHEFGHFNAGHGRYAGWIYRVRESWYRLLDSMQQEGARMGGIFTRFFSWYAPYFNAYSFVFARGNEYEADAVSARLVGADSMGQALVRTDLAARRLSSRFWPDVQRLNLVQAEPPASLFGSMASAVRGSDEGDADALKLALEASSNLDDTHPTLTQRLRALGVSARLPESPERTAAEALLGPLADTLQAQFDASWHESAKPGWAVRYQQHAEGRERLQQLRTLRGERALDAAEAVQYAVLVDDLEPNEDAAPLFEAALELDANDALAHYRLGVLLLEKDDRAAAEHLEAAMRADADAMPHALHLLASLHERRGDDAALDAIRARQEAYFRSQQQAVAARQELGKKDTLEAHGLDAATADATRNQIAAHGKIGKAWVVRKRVPGDEHYPHFILMVEWRGIVAAEEKQLQRLLDAIELPGTIFAVTTSVGSGIAKRVKRAAGAPMFNKGWFG